MTEDIELVSAHFEHNRIFLDIESEDGDSIRLYTDTGGGKIIYAETADQLRLEGKLVTRGGEELEVVDLAPILEARHLPPTVSPSIIYRGERIFDDNTGGMLGAIWFADKIWRFDYQNQTLTWVQQVDWEKIPTEHRVELGFISNMFGKHATHFPRIPIMVEGKTIQTLFDTGATAFLSDSASTYFDGATSVGTSFMSASVFDQWRADHPEWSYIPKGDSLIQADMIEVPEVSIAGHTVGPVWFARRNDHNFAEFMSQWMDEPIKGAIGGSCFQYFSTILIDYPKELLWMEK